MEADQWHAMFQNGDNMTYRSREHQSLAYHPTLLPDRAKHHLVALITTRLIVALLL